MSMVDAFIRMQNRPFELGDYVHAAGVPHEEADRQLREAEKRGKVRAVRGAYVPLKQKKKQVAYDFRPDATKLRRILLTMTPGTVYTTKELDLINRVVARRTLSRYLWTLEYLGCVELHIKNRELIACRKADDFDDSKIPWFFEMNQKRENR